MNKKPRQIVLLTLFLIVCALFVANAQEGKLLQSEEKVVLFTDRSIYIVGEQIYFSAALFNSDSLNGALASQIIYCELVTPDGIKIAGDKFLVNRYSVSGSLEIPPDLLTGTYYIRAYTKLMRNYGPESFRYNQIRIVNAGRPELAATSVNQKTEGQQAVVDSAKIYDKSFSVVTNSTHYSAHDTVTISVGANAGPKLKMRSLCLSVVPEAAKSSSAIIPETLGANENSNIYYAENHGLSLIGRLNYGASETPIKGKKVNLSIMGEGRDFISVRTDSSGRFFFALPNYYGSRDLFLCSERLPSKDVKIWVDNDFCTTPYSLPAPTFSLSNPERNAVYNMATNVQIQSQYACNAMPDCIVNRKEEQAFYAKPTSIIYLDQYIQLPTLEDYFNELPSQVKIRKHKGEPYFYVTGSRNVSFYDPLVLIDWVAVDEPSKILAIPPQNVSRIEIVNETYIKGNQTYGGIISIVSKKGDFAGIDLPSTGIFINYRFLSESRLPKTGNFIKPNSPDTRNTLLWCPELLLKEDRKTNFSVLTPDTPGRYIVFLEGISVDGETFSKTCTFEVNN